MMAGIEARGGSPERAAHLFGAANALRIELATPLAPGAHRLYDEHIALARASLAPQAWADAWKEGARMTLEQAVTLALGDEHQP